MNAIARILFRSFLTTTFLLIICTAALGATGDEGDVESEAEQEKAPAKDISDESSAELSESPELPENPEKFEEPTLPEDSETISEDEIEHTVSFRMVAEYSQITLAQQRYTLGWGQGTTQAASKIRNTGYLGMEYRQWNKWTLGQVGLFVDSFHLPSNPKMGGIKFRLYLYQETGEASITLLNTGISLLDAKHELIGFGFQVKPVFQPIKGLFLNAGFSTRPFFTSFDWSQPYFVIHEWQAGADWFLGNNIALTSEIISVTGFSGFIPENLGTGIWAGLRLQF